VVPPLVSRRAVPSTHSALTFSWRDDKQPKPDECHEENNHGPSTAATPRHTSSCTQLHWSQLGPNRTGKFAHQKRVNLFALNPSVPTPELSHEYHSNDTTHSRVCVCVCVCTQQLYCSYRAHSSGAMGVQVMHHHRVSNI
jgi:hypothetical protein